MNRIKLTPPKRSAKPKYTTVSMMLQKAIKIISERIMSAKSKTENNSRANRRKHTAISLLKIETSAEWPLQSKCLQVGTADIKVDRGFSHKPKCLSWRVYEVNQTIRFTQTEVFAVIFNFRLNVFCFVFRWKRFWASCWFSVCAGRSQSLRIASDENPAKPKGAKQRLNEQRWWKSWNTFSRRIFVCFGGVSKSSSQTLCLWSFIYVVHRIFINQSYSERLFGLDRCFRDIRRRMTPVGRYCHAEHAASQPCAPVGTDRIILGRKLSEAFKTIINHSSVLIWCTCLFILRLFSRISFHSLFSYASRYGRVSNKELVKYFEGLPILYRHLVWIPL